ncbi:MAG: glutamate racemase [Phycisphaerales bacterium]|nr:glutamate racemase [Phycisphaerales bacterium]
MDKKLQVAPIGVFDSGYGGLTVLKELQAQLPQYDFIYLGDNARAPYGNRSFEVVYQYTLSCVRWLFEQNCPLVILACNTASAKALRTIQQNDLSNIDSTKRVLGVIRPTAEVIGKHTKTKVIGILGTSGTVQSNSYPIEINKFFPEVAVYQHPCPMWVPLIENNEFLSAGAYYFIEQDLERLLSQNSNIDTILLGCTHYPLIEPILKKIIGSRPITLLSQGAIVAHSLDDYLKRHVELRDRCTRSATHKYCTTDDYTIFEDHSRLFLGHRIKAESIQVQ